MKILMLTPYLPYPLVSGGQIRTYNLLKNLAKDHQITLFSLIKHASDKKHIQAIEPYCHQIRVFKRSTKPFTLKNIIKTGISQYPFVVTRNLVSETVSAVAEELQSNQYDLIHAETFYMMPSIPKSTIPIILVEQTIEYLGYQSYAKASKRWYIKPLLYIDIAKIKHWETHYWQEADSLITMSPEDKDYIKSHSQRTQPIDVVANGVDISFFDQVPKRLPSDPTVLFVGTFSWLPNVQAVNYLVNQVWPLILDKMPNAKLNIVGFQPTKEIISHSSQPSITVNGSVADIRQAYATAHILVAPVMWGKGTRYKILESMATKTPIVATDIAVEGISQIKPNTHVLIANSAKQLARQSIKLLNDASLQHQLATASYNVVKSEYNWQVISRTLANIYQRYAQH